MFHQVYVLWEKPENEMIYWGRDEKFHKQYNKLWPNFLVKLFMLF